MAEEQTPIQTVALVSSYGTFFMSPSLRTEVNRSAAFRNCSFGMPVIRSTVSGV